MARHLSVNTKEVIIQSAEALISSKGVNGFSLRDVAKKAKISLGTLTYFFNTKDDLIYELIIIHMNEFEKDYYSWLIRHKDDLTKERFLEVVFYKGTKLFNRAKMHIFIINECLKDNENLKNKYNELWERWYSLLLEGVKMVFPNEKDQETLTFVLMFLIDGLVIQEVLHSKTVSTQKLIDFFIKRENEQGKGN